MQDRSKDDNGSCHVDKGTIIGIDGGVPWTQGSDTNIMCMAQEEGAKIAHCFKTNDFSSLQANGVIVEGVKYQFLRVADIGSGSKLVLAKKKDSGALTIQASKTAIVVGHCPEGGQHGNTNKAVSYIAEYLESQGM